ncbi:hypothetical protein HanIR_Chr04g0176251 [Helianthus annuus]|nr:hypothetical protein HanIR_Chr04g0176251 [Helianthus annuus]
MKELLELHKWLAMSNYKKMIQTIILGACWVIWKSRNERIFSGIRVNIDKIFGELQALSFLWIKHRAKRNDLVWIDWVCFSIEDI